MDTSGSLREIGIKENDFILVVKSLQKSQGQDASLGSNAATSASRSSPIARAAPSGVNPFGAFGGGPVYFKGMDLGEVMARNKNPGHIVQIVQSDQNLMLQANFHNKELSEIFQKDAKTATKELSKFMMFNSAFSTMSKLKKENEESEMKARLAKNKDDEEAKKFFSEKERKQLIDEQYYTIMNEYPESMTSVLMLYINVKINGIPVQAFVDSGAQTSVMSLRCAKRVGIDNLVDERFSAMMVGVGSAKSLGRIHLAPLSIEGNFFPLTLTVLNDEKGLGDKNMDFLLGLDMLKRHRCALDLIKGVLRFQGSGQQFVETPFLHEKDLPTTKGGTQDFDPNKEVSKEKEKEKK